MLPLEGAEAAPYTGRSILTVDLQVLVNGAGRATDVESDLGASVALFIPDVQQLVDLTFLQPMNPLRSSALLDQGGFAALVDLLIHSFTALKDILIVSAISLGSSLNAAITAA